MNNFSQEKNPSHKIGFVIILLIVALMFSSSVFSQENDVQIKQIDTISLKLEHPAIKNDTIGFLKKIMKFFKFRDNRNLKEQERIYNYLDSLVVKGDLQVDTVAIESIVIQIRKAFKKDSLFLEENKFSIDSLGEISKKEIDSLNLILNTILVKLKNNDHDETKKINDTIAVSLKDLREVSYSYNNIERILGDTIIKNGQKFSFKKYLKPKQNKEIIGWHNPWTRSAYKNYNYNYLTAINLYGFELSPSGSHKNKEDYKEFFKSGGVADYAKANKCPVYLTIFSKSPRDIAAFLRNAVSQEKLFEQLHTLIVVDKIVNGINIFFENISENDQQLFVDFMEILSEKLKEMQGEIKEEDDESKTISGRENEIKLHLTIPSIYNSESLKNSSAYRFDKLNDIVSYYIVMTGKMTNFKNNWAQSSSPLYDNDDLTQGSIEATINFYSNGKIPISKLVMTVSYLGITWSVNDISGKVKDHRLTDVIPYKKIIREYKRNRDLEIRDHYTEEFDTFQVAAYLSIIHSEWKTTQIWYEDIRSLRQKYEWALDKNLGGVSIRGLGYDDGYPELWNIMGTTLIEIDSITKLVAPFKTETTTQCVFKPYKSKMSITEIFEKKSWNFFDTTSIKDSTSIWYKFQKYNYSNDTISKSKIDKFLEKYELYSDYRWAKEAKTSYVTDYGKSIPDINSEERFLNDEETCRCLYERLIVFSIISFCLAGIFCILFIVPLRIRLKYLDRFNKGGNLERFIIKTGTLIFIILGVILIFYGLYIIPYFPEFGASNEGEVKMRLLFILILFGVLLGLYISYFYSKGKYLKKNMP